MGDRLTAVTALFALGLLAPSLAGAETQRFPTPVLHGLRLDWCAHFGADCGKPAADLFCREKGFTEASRFAIDQNIGSRGVQTLVFGDGRTCAGPSCSGFSVIACTRPDSLSPSPPRVLATPPQPVRPVRPPGGLAITPPPPPKAVPPPAVLPPALAIKPATPPPPPSVRVTPPPPPPKAAREAGVPPTGPTAKRPPPPGPPPPPPGQPPPSNQAVAGGPKYSLPEGAELYSFCKGTGCPVKPTVLSINPENPVPQSVTLMGDASTVANAVAFRWQAATAPFPEFANGSAADIKPPHLFAWGEVDANKGSFPFFLKTSENQRYRGGLPESFYVRIIPLGQPDTTEFVGRPSNTVRIYYAAQAPQQVATPKIPVMTPPPLFAVKILNFIPPSFEDPNKAGCIIVSGYKPGVSDIVASNYHIGGKCPHPAGQSGGIGSPGDLINYAINHVPDAWDWIADGYNELKGIAVDVTENYTFFGIQCKAAAALAKKAVNKDPAEICHEGATIAVDAGMAELNLPPSLPNYDQLVDEGVDSATDAAADKFTEETGIPCEGPCRDALHGGLQAAGNVLKNNGGAGTGSGCANTKAAGSWPLCPPSGVIWKPAPGSIYSPPVIVVAVTRTNADRDPNSGFKGSCYLSIGFSVDNLFSGGNVYGPGNASETIPPTSVQGWLYSGNSLTPNEAMPKGSSKIFAGPLNHPLIFEFDWTKKLWANSAIKPRDETGPMGPDWFSLYTDGTAKVTASGDCFVNADTMAVTLPKPFS